MRLMPQSSVISLMVILLQGLLQQQIFERRLERAFGHL